MILDFPGSIIMIQIIVYNLHSLWYSSIKAETGIDSALDSADVAQR